MPLLQFPTDRIVGTLDWNGSWTDERGPVLATGAVSVPDDVTVRLDVQTVRGSRADGGGSWSIDIAPDPVNLRFLSDLPENSIESLTLHRSDEVTIVAIRHLAPGLRKLYLVWAGFTDAILETVATLTGLTWLQTFGNTFTDRGVQQLATLVNLDNLYLEEETLTAAAFAFVDQLPHLDRLGIQDVQLDDADFQRLRDRLFPIRVIP